MQWMGWGWGKCALMIVIIIIWWWDIGSQEGRKEAESLLPLKMHAYVMWSPVSKQLACGDKRKNKKYRHSPPPTIVFPSPFCIPAEYTGAKRWRTGKYSIILCSYCIMRKKEGKKMYLCTCEIVVQCMILYIVCCCCCWCRRRCIQTKQTMTKDGWKKSQAVAIQEQNIFWWFSYINEAEKPIKYASFTIYRIHYCHLTWSPVLYTLPVSYTYIYYRI